MRIELLASRLEMVMNAFGATGREHPWVPFKDRKPDADVQVLTWRPRGGGYPPLIEIGQVYNKKLLLPETWIELDATDDCFWRPLPAGPGEKPADQPASDVAPLDFPPDLGLLRTAEGFVLPRVQLRYRCGKQGIATDDAPCAIVVLPAPNRPEGQYLCNAVGTPEQVWKMTQVVMRYAKDNGILDLAKAGAFGPDQGPPQGRIISDKQYGGPG